MNTDEKRVMQVLLCLQSNALKFTRKGSVTIEVCIENHFLKISVIDTGIGIPLEDQEKLFKLFGFVQSTSHLNKNGIGLGLVIADQIVAQFEGSISFKSTPGVGSIFTYTMKLYRENPVDSPCLILKNNDRAVEVDYQIDSKQLVFNWQPDLEMNKRPVIFVNDLNLE